MMADYASELYKSMFGSSISLRFTDECWSKAILIQQNNSVHEKRPKDIISI